MLLCDIWRLSVAYIGPKSRTERPRKTKIGTEVVHVIRDVDTTFKVKMSKGQGHQAALLSAGKYCYVTSTRRRATGGGRRGREHVSQHAQLVIIIIIIIINIIIIIINIFAYRTWCWCELYATWICPSSSTTTFHCFSDSSTTCSRASTVRAFDIPTSTTQSRNLSRRTNTFCCRSRSASWETFRY